MNTTANPEFSLDSEELLLVNAKRNKSNKLAFAILLKSFQRSGDFSNDLKIVSDSLGVTIASQLALNQDVLHDFDWNSRTVKRFRQEIRNFYGYTAATVKDSKAFVAWLISNVLPNAQTLPQCRERAKLFFKEQKLESFSEKEIDRYINSARQSFEQDLFHRIFSHLSEDTKTTFEALLLDDSDVDDDEEITNTTEILLRHLKRSGIGSSLQIADNEVFKLNKLYSIKLPVAILASLPRKLIKKYYQRIMADLPGSIKSREPVAKYAMLAMFCYMRTQIVTDNMIDLLIKLILNMHARSESFVKKEIVKHVAKSNGRFDILMNLANAAVAHPKGIIEDIIYPQVSQETLISLIEELKSDKRGRWYQQQVQGHMRLLYSSSHRKSRLALLNTLIFNSSTEAGKALIRAIDFIKKNQGLEGKYYPAASIIPIKGVIPGNWLPMVVETTEISEKEEEVQEASKVKVDSETEDNVVDEKGVVKASKINKMNYEVAVFETLRAKLYCKEIWVDRSYRYQDPKEDEVKDFSKNEDHYFDMLGLHKNVEDFISALKQELSSALNALNDSILKNNKVKIVSGKIRITPFEAQKEPDNIIALKQEITKRWFGVGLIDIFKEASLRTRFTKHFQSSGNRIILDAETYTKRALLALYAIGTNIGIKKCVDASNDDSIYSDLRYVKRKFINSANVREAIVEVINALLLVRDPDVWGTPTTGCACDSTHMQAWDHNFMSNFHPRYKKDGVMIYWHTDKKAACIYGQLKNCTSSEVASMLVGFLWHGTNMDMKQCYMDTHGQSLLGFAFSRLLHLDLLPRIKGIHKEKLYCFSSDPKEKYGNLIEILGESLNEEVIRRQYHEIVRYTAALRTGATEPEVIVRQFGKDNEKNPTYQALIEIGRAVKTIFICRYLQEESLRIEINEALNVVERVNSVVSFIFYGKLSSLSHHQPEEQELSVVCLHLLQVCMVYINTLMIQQILSEPEWKDRLTAEDKRALSPLIFTHINPYGLLVLNLEERIAIETYHVQDKTYVFNRTNTGQTKSKRVGEAA